MAVDSSNLCTSVVEAISDVEDVEQTNLDYSLYDYIDPDVLDRLASRDDSEWQLTFVVDDHFVVADSKGTLTVDEQYYDWDTV